MPPAFKVELLAHDPEWHDAAQKEIAVLKAELAECLVTIHHVGSTAIAGIHAKPVFDLIPVVHTVEQLDAYQHTLEALGYEWWGEFGLPGRRYCTKEDAVNGKRLVQLHCYAQGSDEITRHLAFRDYLRAHPIIAQNYDAVKAHCRNLHPDNSHDYGDCKHEWISKTEAAALRWYNSHTAQ
ncbi:GrpB family protein [Ochrobactrum sp. SFR4]|uniref:GrpB family protein n=1 Tax=Ochrobactrum sp. SFR4 TaxID=2717368 RepID=UPI001C8C9275|nr:GrpB family protein [Ochrobactrum sp. SFR4]MBX8824862.1 GrpB family protein [Ochrobactrum sp. SFR4]